MSSIWCKKLDIWRAQGAEAQPWNICCLATAESSNQRIVGPYGFACKNIRIGDKAVFNHKGDTVFWVNGIPYTVSRHN